jgi:hypothetical protein
VEIEKAPLFGHGVNECVGQFSRSLNHVFFSFLSFSFFFFFLRVVVLGAKLRASWLLGRCTTTELLHQPTKLDLKSRFHFLP